jgi:hypothetical protein
MADYYHCASHRLNLALSDAALLATAPSVSRLMQRVNQIIVYIRASPKRTEMLSQACLAHQQKKNKKLMKFSPTRWVERWKSLQIFKDLLPAILSTLTQLLDTERDHQAENLLSGFTTKSTIFALLHD